MRQEYDFRKAERGRYSGRSMKVVGTNRESEQADLERLIPVSEAAKMLGLSPDAIRKRLAGTESLTLVDQSTSRSSRPRYFLVLGEILAYRRKLIEDARRRTNIAARLDKFFR